MTRHFFTFLGTFVVGALIALVARAAWFDPNGDHTAPPLAVAGAPVATHPSAAANAQDAHATHAPAPGHDGHGGATSPSADAHGAHSSASAAVSTVNTVCAICGMEVDPELPTADYQGKKIGFGCKACPAKFKADPDKYGPAALRNEVVED